MAIFKRKKHRVTPFAETAGAEGFGAPLHIAFEYRELPGSGARQYAYETLALPMYTPIGWGVANKQAFAAFGTPVVAWDQTIGIESLIYNGNYSGQITTAPLLNTDSGTDTEMPVTQSAYNYNLPS